MTGKALTKRSKAAIYKNQLDKATALLKEVQRVSSNFEYMGVEAIFELEEELNELNFKIGDFLEDTHDETI